MDFPAGDSLSPQEEVYRKTGNLLPYNLISQRSASPEEGTEMFKITDVETDRR